jgi:AraC-like DNA-binding protein
VGCSAAHLRRLFQDAGMAPIMGQLDERRLTRATSLLAEGRWHTDYVARQCGWRSAGAMTHAFRRRFGCSVRQWMTRASDNQR